MSVHQSVKAATTKFWCLHCDLLMSTRGRGRTRALTRAEERRSSSSSHTHDLDVDVSATLNDPRIAVKIKGRTLSPSHKISSKLKQIFEGSVHHQGMAWKFIPNEHKDLFFGEFKKQCTWDVKDDGMIHSLFFKKAARHYSDWLSDIKKKGQRPLFISQDVWPL